MRAKGRVDGPGTRAGVRGIQGRRREWLQFLGWTMTGYHSLIKAMQEEKQVWVHEGACGGNWGEFGVSGAWTCVECLPYFQILCWMLSIYYVILRNWPSRRWAYGLEQGLTLISQSQKPYLHLAAGNPEWSSPFPQGPTAGKGQSQN